MTDQAKRIEGPTMSFFESTDLETLAADQGVSAVSNFDALLGDFWPEDETADFVAAVREWRHEGEAAEKP